MMVAWSNDEVAQYIAQFKIYEHKSADTLKEKVHQQYREQLQHVLTTGKRVNKTDANNLASQFGVRAIVIMIRVSAAGGTGVACNIS
jgi:DNA excision repair protein ERCC-1